jgi:hypothetical protein
MIFSILLIGLLHETFSFIAKNNVYPTSTTTSTSRLYYNYFKKDGEKREIGRLWKNIIFPGIYQEYQDTKEPIKTIKITTVTPKRVSLRDLDAPAPQTSTYNMVDPSTAPRVRAIFFSFIIALC